jgi:hypothetical protein
MIGVILFVVFAAFYCIVFAPKVCANVASENGLSSMSWFFNVLFFNVFAVIYLAFFVLKDVHKRHRRTLVLISLGYIGIFIGAFLIDQYSKF